MLNLWPCIGPKGEKGVLSNLGSQVATLRSNVPAFINFLMSMFWAFISNLGQNNKPIMLEVDS
jgi:hypothetical protein